MNILLSIIIATIIFIPSIKSIIKTPKINNILKLLFIKLLPLISLTLLIFTIFNPSNEFKKEDFEKEYSLYFKTKIPSEIKYIATNYHRGNYTARIRCGEKFYNKFLIEIEKDNYDSRYINNIKSKNNFIDKTTGEVIKYSFKSHAMSGGNYEIDFFDDNKTIRIYIVYYG
ncbi:hypothetical protein G1K66_03305 [Tenacibaculum finnmarkense]|uniref:hypothetical protein n=1 Tax=Tenacibaculum finnmarkense TaxID=2781243 RepID=UPI00187B39A3|nr:hypothetical protein [Tenacibaculum finnmarkense]MBE7647639.1 hypothetical protein [Tenacibaculum finnmarkense genomovar ulcerans]MCD8400098.1 hypothetical protein [Tenacibaculum finnmarkense genomovar ulcerans]MCG8785294.1 hypothetical protein [Tenacibaculum finnmarkense]MCG8795796.1 hypothetical protein [Tenacibaculum finnmarkense]MCG8798213.1 hypothetical protein [Tenacibaculum finnmarkense]